MPLDGIFLSKLCRELQGICGCRIDKISQPSKDELVLSLRSVTRSGRLLISARPGAARVHLSEQNFENPAVPPMFCMLMRKHLLGGKILSLTQEGFERAVTLTVLATDEMGEKRENRLICEMIGNQSNIILVGHDGRIIDCVRRSDIESGTRLVQPGARYMPPEAPDKVSPFEDGAAERVLLDEGKMISKALLENVAGISPLIAGEAAAVCFSADIPTESAPADAGEKLASFLAGLDGEGTPYILYDEQGLPKDFSYHPITQYGTKYRGERAESYCRLLDRFYAERDRLHRLKHSASDVYKALSNAAARCEKKLHLRKKELEKCADREQYRIRGELIKANLHLIERGAAAARVPNYYDPDLREINIPLNPALSPAANSARYFKEYRKLCSAEQTLGGLIAEAEREREYIASVKDMLSRCETLAEILDIRDELIASGYIKRQGKKVQKRPALKPHRYLSSDGFVILVGRNNVQNDVLTLKTAAKDDLWLHTKNIHGSHVIIVCEGATPPERTVLEAAELAAFHSQARSSSQVPVDYTLVKNVKKPSGAKPGMVIYKTNSTVFVTPREPQKEEN